jgi:SnoaL-like domain
MPSAESLLKHLDAVYSQLESLRLDSASDDFEKFASFFAEDSTVYLRSMREHAQPARGREAIMDHLKDILKDQIFEKRRVVSQTISEGDSRIWSEMENRYIVHNQPLDPFHEAAVVTFDNDGLVSTWKQYSCRSHIVMLIQKSTGIGPFSETVVR